MRRSPPRRSACGPFGTGRQWMSWNERDDLVRLIVHAIATPALGRRQRHRAGVDAQCRLRARSRSSAATAGRGACSGGVLRAVGGRLAEELLLAEQRVLPAKALESGFVFRHRTLPGAFAAILWTAPLAMRRSRARLVGKWLT